MEILLTQNKITYVDDELYDKIMKRGKWCAACDNGNYYAITTIYKNGKKTTLKMHRFIYELKHGPISNGMHIDHDNNDSLDNHSANLIARTPQEHKIKHTCQKPHSSLYTGVSWDKRSSRWCVRIRIGGKEKHIGYYDSELHAYEAYQTLKSLTA